MHSTLIRAQHALAIVSACSQFSEGWELHLEGNYCSHESYSFVGFSLKPFSMVIYLQEKAYEESEKYKEGMYVLEKERTLRDGW